MIEFRQKVFFLNAIMAAGTVIGIGQASSQMKQTEEHMRQEKQLEKSRQRFEKKQQEEQLKAQKEQQEKQLQLQREQMKQQRELQREGNTMAAVAPSSSDIQSMAEKGFSMVEFKRKKFGAVWNWQNIKGLAKDTGSILKDNKHHWGKMAAAGLAMGVGSFVVNRAISNDMKKSGINLDQMRRDTEQQSQQNPNFQKTYSAIPQFLSKAGNKMSSIWKSAKKNGYNKEILIGAGFPVVMAVPTVMGYMGEKKQLQDQYGQQNQIPQVSQQQRQYGIGSWIAQKGRGLVNATKPIREHPGQTVLGFISQLSMGGGHKAAEGAARDFVNQGAKSGNVLTQKVGNFLTNHKKTAIAATIPVGLTTTSALWEGGEKLAKKVGGTVDKNAYTYENWKEKQIEE